MVSPLPIYLPETLQFRAAPKNAVHFLYGAVLHRPALLPPLQSVFAKDTSFLSAKAQKLQNSACAEFWDGLPVFALELGILITEFSVSWIRWLWLEGLSKEGLFGCQSGIRGLWLGAFGK